MSLWPIFDPWFMRTAHWTRSSLDCDCTLKLDVVVYRWHVYCRDDKAILDRRGSSDACSIRGLHTFIFHWRMNRSPVSKCTTIGLFREQISGTDSLKIYTVSPLFTFWIYLAEFPSFISNNQDDEDNGKIDRSVIHL